MVIIVRFPNEYAPEIHQTHYCSKLQPAKVCQISVSVTDILENSRNILFASLLPKKQILDLVERPLLAGIDKMVPRASITIQHSGSLNILQAVRPTPFAFESVMGVAPGIWFELEEFSQGVEGEMTLDIFCGVHDARRKGLFVGLALEDFLFD